jgi:hypothetical protein
MMDHTSKEISLEDGLARIKDKLSKRSSGIEAKKRNLPITIWVPEETKMNYDIVQDKTDRELSNVIRDLIITTVRDTVKLTT